MKQKSCGMSKRIGTSCTYRVPRYAQLCVLYIRVYVIGTICEKMLDPLFRFVRSFSDIILYIIFTSGLFLSVVKNKENQNGRAYSFFFFHPSFKTRTVCPYDVPSVRRVCIFSSTQTPLSI